MTTPRPTRPRVMELIRERRVKLDLSFRRAATLAGISETRWRQLEQGYRVTNIGDAPEPAPDRTLARMAYAVGVGEDELRRLGLDEAADRLGDYAAARDAEDAEDARDAAAMVGTLGRAMTARVRARLEADVTEALHRIRTENGRPGVS